MWIVAAILKPRKLLETNNFGFADFDENLIVHTQPWKLKILLFGKCISFPELV